MSYPPPNSGPPPQGMYPNPVYNSNYPAPPPGYPSPNAPGYAPPPGPGYGPAPGYGSSPPGYQPMPYPPPGQSPGPYGPPPGQSPGPYGPPPGQSPGPYGQPITNQPGPGQGGWMNIPQGIPNCPPGLEYLTTIDQLLVRQKVELMEALTQFETQNKFTIKNSQGQKVYYAVEESDCLTRNCCGPLRPFEMRILDNYEHEVIHLNRPLAADSCCFPCCLQSMEVSSPPGTIIGTVEQEWSILKPSFVIRDSRGEIVLRIEGPFCLYKCGDTEFKIMSADGKVQVGKISKQWSGLLREMFTDSDYFGISFPMDLDVRMKAVMLGACFLIDVMFFESTSR